MSQGQRKNVTSDAWQIVHPLDVKNVAIITSALSVWILLTCAIKRSWFFLWIALLFCWFITFPCKKVFAFYERTILYLQQILVVLVNLTRVKGVENNNNLGWRQW